MREANPLFKLSPNVVEFIKVVKTKTPSFEF
jgi:hypothetical protein